MFPTTPRCRSRSTKISLTRSSSRMATCVSWPLAVMIISFDIRETPCEKGGWPLFRLRIGRNSRAERANDDRDFSQSDAHGSDPLVGEPAHPHVEDQAEACQR